MIVLPAMDLYKRQVVRLERGDYKKMTVYHDNPLEKAQEIKNLGAEWLHVVDLAAADSGDATDTELLQSICRETGLRVEIGGGIRSMEQLEKCCAAGVERVILGTMAVTDQGFLREAYTEYGKKVAVGVDILDQKIAIRGWKEYADEPVEHFFDTLCRMGIQTVICTDISRDGMMGGANTELYRRLSEAFPLQLIASGGVSSLEDLHRLKGLGLYGAILGKAMYQGAVRLEEALQLAAAE